MYDRPNLTTNTTSIRGDPQNKDTCPRCGGIVFHAERMLSKNNVRKKKSKKSRKIALSILFRFSVFPQKMLHLLRLQTAPGFNNCQWCSQQWNILQSLLWQKFRAQRIRIWGIKCTCPYGWWTRTICRRPVAVSI